MLLIAIIRSFVHVCYLQLLQRQWQRSKERYIRALQVTFCSRHINYTYILKRYQIRDRHEIAEILLKVALNIITPLKYDEKIEVHISFSRVWHRGYVI
jgi:gluconate kinase